MAYAEVTPGDVESGVMNVIIEIRKGERNKYEFDKETGRLFLDRVNGTFLGCWFIRCKVRDGVCRQIPDCGNGTRFASSCMPQLCNLRARHRAVCQEARLQLLNSFTDDGANARFRCVAYDSHLFSLPCPSGDSVGSLGVK